MTDLKEKYTKEIAPNLMKELGLKNLMSVPKLKKVVINVGLSAMNKDPKIPEVAENVLKRIAGQNPVKTLAKKSIANFKIRKGAEVGLMVTLRGKRMYDFVNKLVNVTFPRVRDFRGISEKLVDGKGNMSVGFREYIVFPEIRPDEVEKLHGLQVTLVANAGERKAGLALFRALGMPFHN